MNTHKTYRSALILGAKPLHRLTAAVGVASLGLFAGQAHAQESVEERLSALEQQLAEVEPHARESRASPSTPTPVPDCCSTAMVKVLPAAPI